jgi:hypothetical protein
MAYGRLDIFFPDGTFKTYTLTQSVTTIGHAPDQMIRLGSEAISPAHLRLQYQDGQASVIDSATRQGTFVDGERLKAGEANPLFGGEEILIGDIRLIYHFYDDSPTRPVVVPEEATQRIEAPAHDFAIDILGPDQAVSPGAHIAAQLTIHNLSERGERYTIEINGLPREWIKLDPSVIEVPPGQMGDIIVTFKPSRRPESAPGRYRALVTVRPRNNPDAALKAEVILDILPFSGFGMALEETEIPSGGRFKLYLHNQGSAPLNLVLSTRDLSNKLRITLPNPNIQLAPGQRSVVQGIVASRNMLPFGETRLLPFDLIVRSRDSSGFLAAQRAKVSSKASLPRWAPAAALAGLGALALLVVVAILLALVRPTEQPSIVSFAPSSSNIIQGQPLILNWDTSNADTLALLVNGRVVSENIDPARNSLEVDTSAYIGSVFLTLRASNSGGIVEESREVEITPLLTLDYFEIMPSTLFRNVIQSITLNWRVVGAVSTRLTGLEGITQSQLPANYVASGTVTVPVLPISDFAITLIAEGAAESELQQPVTVSVIDPLCAPAGADTTIYTAPSLTAQPVTSITSGTFLPVDKRDASGQWLRFVLPDGSSGWAARNLLSCVEGFNPDGLLIEAILPPTLSLTATPFLPQSTLPPATATPVAPVQATPTARLGG